MLAYKIGNIVVVDEGLALRLSERLGLPIEETTKAKINTGTIPSSFDYSLPKKDNSKAAQWADANYRGV